MSTLTFVDTHNMVAFLQKPNESEGFEQIVDFLNAHPVRVATSSDEEPTGDEEDTSKQGSSIADINENEQITLDNVYNVDMAHEETVLSMQDVQVKEKVAKEVVEVMKIVKIIVDEVSTAGVQDVNTANEEPVSAAPTNITTAQPSEITKTNVVTTQVPEKKESEAVEGSSKRSGEDLEQEMVMKQKIEEEKETKELNECMKIIPDDEDDVTIEAIPLSSKSPTIIGYKIHIDGKKKYFQVFRADGNSQMYLAFSKMLKNFNKEDLETTHYYLLVAKMYPLTKYTLQQMWNDLRLQVDYECEMAYDLLRLKDDSHINNDIMRFSSCDKGGELKKHHIKNLEEELGEEEPKLPMRSIPRTDEASQILGARRL
uniref:Uncharacterized protein n=1 Tax=Tanacetum cinerariifolium TaxID=118510 RepID=A0A6L2P7B9_TANCI|nr:hypothetical protein [Tanacetum cinerariifolium]